MVIVESSQRVSPSPGESNDDGGGDAGWVYTVDVQVPGRVGWTVSAVFVVVKPFVGSYSMVSTSGVSRQGGDDNGSGCGVDDNGSWCGVDDESPSPWVGGWVGW